MGSESHMVLVWTAQAPAVVETIQRAGVSYVKKEYIRKKYQETAWIFETAYSYFISKFTERIPKPDLAQSPIWVYKDPKWAMMTGNESLLKLEVPDDQIVLFDRRKWNDILNLSYIGTQEEKRVFEDKLLKQGISDETALFENAYYPLLRREVVKSWDSLFEIRGLSDADLQGAVWCLKQTWIV